MSSSGEEWNQGHTFSYRRDGKRSIWRVVDLWEAAKGLPVTAVPLSDLRETHDLAQWVNTWDTVNDGLDADDRRRVLEADLSYPIILHPEDFVMDGYHRIARCLRDGLTHVQTVQFTPDNLPPPTWDLND